MFQFLLSQAVGNCQFEISASDIEWNQIYTLAEKHSLTGILVYSLEHLPRVQWPPMEMMMDWLGQAERIKTVNRHENSQCALLQQRCKEAGLSTTILKGQGVASLYGDMALYRQSGDIDLWVDGDWRAVIDFVNLYTPNRDLDHKHAHLNVFPDTAVEVHWWPSVSTNPIVNRRLKKYYREHAARQCMHEVQVEGEKGPVTITATDAWFDSVHVLLHIYGHFLYEGVGLRQVMDYCMVLRALRNETTGCAVQDSSTSLRMTYYDDIVRLYRQLGLYDFACQVMYVMREVFGMPEEYLITPVDEQGGKELLKEILESGNMGHAAQENLAAGESWPHRMMRRIKRKLKLIRYNPLGVICSPVYKIRLLIWKQWVIWKYNL